MLHAHEQKKLGDRAVKAQISGPGDHNCGQMSKIKKIERKVAAGIDGIETRRPRGSFLAKARGRDGPEVGSKKLSQARESETKATGKACFQRLESHFASPLK